MIGLVETRNSKTLKSFIEYCVEHPQERFWQALRNWAGVGFIYVGDDYYLDIPSGLEDTFYWEEKGSNADN